MTSQGAMRAEYLESLILILYVSDLAAATGFYVDALELPMVFEDDIIVVAGHSPTRVVLHRDDGGHDQRGTFPPGSDVGGAAVRFPSTIRMPASGMLSNAGRPSCGPTQEASWGRFVVLADPDGRAVVLAKMNTGPSPNAKEAPWFSQFGSTIRSSEGHAGSRAPEVLEELQNATRQRTRRELNAPQLRN